MNLNAEQELAVNHGDGCCIVTASPGSGKTSVLTNRVIRLLNEGVSPNNIICLTFTNKAANEMKSRVVAQIKMGNKVWISTFHKLCVAVIRKYAHVIELDHNFSIIDDSDQRSLMKKIARLQGHDVKDNEVDYLCRQVNQFREDLIPYTEYVSTISSRDANITTEYLNTINETKSVDFSGLLYNTYKIIQNEDVLKSLSDRFKYILVDEYQDTNVIQNEIIIKLAGHGNLFVVGDPHQCVDKDQRITYKTSLDSKEITETVENIPTHGFVPCYNNGNVKYNSYIKSETQLIDGVCITLESGKKITVTPNHRFYAANTKYDSLSDINYIYLKAHDKNGSSLKFQNDGVATEENFENYSYTRTRAEFFSKIYGYDIVEYINFDRTTYLIEAQDLSVQNELPVFTGGNVQFEKIVKIENVKSKFYNLSVYPSQNFFCENGILSHNSIYRFRGSKPENMNVLSKKFNAKHIFLPKNYRSTTKILKVAETLIKHNSNAKEVYLESTKDEGEDIPVYMFENPDVEAVYVGSTIQKLKDDGIPYKEMAVLYRSNVLSKPIEQQLTSRGIPYSVVGGYGFFDRKEIKDVLAYITLVVNPYETCSFHRAITNPKRGIGDVMIGKIEKVCKEHKISVFEACDKYVNEIGLSDKAKESFQSFCEVYKNIPTDMVNTVKYLLNKSGYVEYLNSVDDQEQSRAANVLELLNGIDQYKAKNPGSDLGDYLRQISLQTNEDKDAELEDAVRLSTIHAAKGGEWKVVFIVGVEEKLLPHHLCLKGDNIKEEIEEERRLLYTAITRGKIRVYISHNKYRIKQSFSNNKKLQLCEPSRFLKDAGLI